jgi:hypothetical protein
LETRFQIFDSIGLHFTRWIRKRCTLLQVRIQYISLELDERSWNNSQEFGKNSNRENLYIVKTLKEFQYIDEDGKDQGANGMSSLLAERGFRYVL